MHHKDALRRLEQAVPLAQLAVLGTWTKTAGAFGTSTRTVRAFCWPEVGHAWTRLAEAIGTAGRRPPVVPGARWWMAASAPRMCQSLQGEEPLAEATLAALVQRLPIRVTLAVVEESTDRPATLMGRCRALFSESMAPYAVYLHQTNQVARALAITGPVNELISQAQDAAFITAQSLVDEGDRLKPMRLQHWGEGDGEPPLPIELAHVIAQGVSRHLDEPERVSPLMDAIRSKFVGRTGWLGPRSKRGRK